MPACAVPTCKNAPRLCKKQDGITFHMFPADEERKAQWTNILRRARLEELWKPSKWSVVCSVHFDDIFFYETKCGLKRLKKKAFPNKNLAMIAEESETCMEQSKNAKQPPLPAMSNSDIVDVNISDLDSIFDSPKEAKLRSQLSRKQILSEKQARRIKALQQKNRRLSNNNESLRRILRNLKRNRFVNDDVHDHDLLPKNIMAADVFNNV